MAYETYWVAYAKEKPYLPICIRKTPSELAEAVGATLGTVQSTWSRFQHGKLKHARFARVFIERED